ncbi:hypothetical protein Cpir12675_001347 [Ceratocystis pirilliformis]|uniref:Uncharacterized protein n=1 Tax=Ceratocystis pirilliformis TaxID=259994 RepID=A0ABR3ZHN5_9PEZI
MKLDDASEMTRAGMSRQKDAPSLIVRILVDESIKLHKKQVNEVLAELEKADMHLDVDNMEFDLKKTKYLSFIVEVEEQVSMDSAKTETNIFLEKPL